MKFKISVYFFIYSIFLFLHDCKNKPKEVDQTYEIHIPPYYSKPAKFINVDTNQESKSKLLFVYILNHLYYQFFFTQNKIFENKYKNEIMIKKELEKHTKNLNSSWEGKLSGRDKEWIDHINNFNKLSSISLCNKFISLFDKIRKNESDINFVEIKEIPLDGIDFESMFTNIMKKILHTKSHIFTDKKGMFKFSSYIWSIDNSDKNLEQNISDYLAKDNILLYKPPINLVIKLNSMKHLPLNNNLFRVIIKEEYMYSYGQEAKYALSTVKTNNTVYLKIKNGKGKTDKWYKCDDSGVSEADPLTVNDEARKPNSYLFYVLMKN